MGRLGACKVFGEHMGSLDDVCFCCVTVACTAGGPEADTDFGMFWCSQFCRRAGKSPKEPGLLGSRPGWMEL